MTTALYPSHSPFLGTDPVFATRKSLICNLEQVTDSAKWVEWGFDKEDVVKRVLEITGGEGVHAIFDGVGKDTCVLQFFCFSAWGR